MRMRIAGHVAYSPAGKLNYRPALDYPVVIAPPYPDYKPRSASPSARKIRLDVQVVTHSVKIPFKLYGCLTYQPGVPVASGPCCHDFHYAKTDLKLQREHEEDGEKGSRKGSCHKAQPRNLAINLSEEIKREKRQRYQIKDHNKPDKRIPQKPDFSRFANERQESKQEQEAFLRQILFGM